MRIAHSRSIGAALLAAVLVLAGSSASVRADDAESDYLTNLKIAQDKVLRTKKAAQETLSANAVSSSFVKSLLGRYFQVGDSWDVVAYDFQNPMARKTSDQDKLKMGLSQGGSFHYEVVDVRKGSAPQVTLKITQTHDFGLSPVDPKIQSLTLTMSDQLIQSRKAYQVAGQSQPVAASPNGMHSSMTVLELFPLDVPEVTGAKRQKPSAMPELPGKLQEIAQKAWTQSGLQPSLSRSVWLEQDDFFGRPVQMLWQQGDPWPTYLKTSNGISILTRKRTS